MPGICYLEIKLFFTRTCLVNGMVEGKDLVLCPFVSQLYSRKYQDVKCILSNHLFRFEEVLGKRSEGTSSNLEMASDTWGNQGRDGFK